MKKLVLTADGSQHLDMTEAEAAAVEVTLNDVKQHAKNKVTDNVAVRQSGGVEVTIPSGVSGYTNTGSSITASANERRTIQTRDDRDKINLLGLETKALSSTASATLLIRDVTNYTWVLSPSQMTGVLTSVFDGLEEIYRDGVAIKNQIEAAQSVEAVNAINLEV